MERFCKDCAHFTDAHYSRIYISPTCQARGQDAAAYMRAYVCGVDEARLYEPKDKIEHDGCETARLTQG